METTDEEIEQLMKRSQELAAQIEDLASRAQDPAKQLGQQFAALEVQFERMGEVLQTKNAPPGTGVACLEAAMEWIGDFAELEAVALEAMHGRAPARPPSSGQSRPGLRRGLRI